MLPDDLTCTTNLHSAPLSHTLLKRHTNRQPAIWRTQIRALGKWRCGRNAGAWREGVVNQHVVESLREIGGLELEKACLCGGGVFGEL